jgi:hypothetical protein
MNHKYNKNIDTVYIIVFDKDSFMETNPQIFNEFVDLTEKMKSKIEEFPITKDFESEYLCVDSTGKKRKAICSRYTLIYK